MPFDATSESVRVPRARRLNLFALVSIIFFPVSGGAFGLEPLVGSVGAGWAVVLVIVTPLVWSLPTTLMVAELSALMPCEGGYYVWVREALGDFWGVQEGWWTICYTAVDMAIYPVLFVGYLVYFFPSLGIGENGLMTWRIFGLRWLIAVALIAVALIINWLGARAVGRNAAFNIGLVLLPFAVLVVLGLSNESSLTSAFGNIRNSLTNGGDINVISLGLATVLWNYCAWDNVSTFAAEVNDPKRTYPRALFIALPLVVLAYLLPLLAGIAVTTDAHVWSDSAGFPVIAELIGGKVLGLVIAFAALISSWSLFNSQLLYVSRLPFAMARDGWLPQILARTSKKTGTPVYAIIASCAITAIFCALPFGKLVVIDILLYTAELLLEFIALIVLRRTRPDVARPFKVRGGLPVLLLITIAPMCLASVVAYATFRSADTDPRQTIIVVLMIAAGSVLYLLRRGKARRPQSTSLN
ncbi:MAG: amino acid permease [Pyrinomonadaceae bacterium]